MAEGGNDRVSYRNADGAVTIDLSTATFGGAAAGDAFNGIGGVIGTAFADTFQGDAFSSFFQTGGGDDVADGGDGVDILSSLARRSIPRTGSSMMAGTAPSRVWPTP